MDSGEARTQGDDWLFEPAVAQQAPWVDGPRPWRVGSQFYVAFFGGVVAITAIAVANARRLGMTVREQWLMVAGGVVGMVLTGVLAAVIRPELGEGSADTRWVRYGSRAIALVLFVVFSRMQRRSDRLFALQAGDEYESLWGPGIAAVIIGGIAQVVLLLPLVTGI